MSDSLVARELVKIIVTPQRDKSNLVEPVDLEELKYLFHVLGLYVNCIDSGTISTSKLNSLHDWGNSVRDERVDNFSSSIPFGFEMSKLHPRWTSAVSCFCRELVELNNSLAKTTTAIQSQDLIRDLWVKFAESFRYSDLPSLYSDIADLLYFVYADGEMVGGTVTYGFAKIPTNPRNSVLPATDVVEECSVKTILENKRPLWQL